MKYSISLSILCILEIQPSLAQEYDDINAEIPMVILEQYLDEKEEIDTHVDDVIDELHDNPVNLNTASIEELLQIPGVTIFIAQHIIDRRQQKLFTEISDLMGIEGITPQVFSILSRVVTFDGRNKGNHINIRQRNSRDGEERTGYRNGKFLGGPYSSLLKFTSNTQQIPYISEHCISDIRVGVFFKKDAGERLTDNFFTAFLSTCIPALSTRLFIGDFILETGQGLVFWRSSGFSKSTSDVSIGRRQGLGVRPYLSNDENWYFHGIASDVSCKNIDMQFFISKKPMNATIDSSGMITSFDESGLFRTENDLQHRHAVEEQLYGYCISSKIMKRVSVGISGYRSTLNHPIASLEISEKRLQTFDIVGFNVGITGSAYDIFSETAVDVNRHVAGIFGFQISPHTQCLFTIIGRLYPKNFFSLHGNAFSNARGVPKNEEGVYVGTKIGLSERFRLFSYYDQFIVTDKVMYGGTRNGANDFVLQSEYDVTPQSDTRIRFREEQGQIHCSGYDIVGRTTNVMDKRKQTSCRWDITYRPTSNFESLSRVEWTWVNYQLNERSESGMYLMQDLTCKPFKGNSMNARIIFFRTDSYDSRLSAFESELIGSFSNSSLYGEGIHWYIMMQQKIYHQIFISFKYAQTEKEFVHSIGSGVDEIEGSVSDRFSMQLDCAF